MTIQEAYKFCAFCGTAYTDFSQPHHKCDNCGKILFANFNTSVGILCVNSKSKVVFIRRGHEPGKGSLDLPAGFVDISDSSLEAAAVREMEEETGIVIDPATLSYIGSYAGTYNFQDIDNPNLTIYFACYTDLIATAGDDAASMEYYNIDEVPESEIYFAQTKKALADYRLSLTK